MVIEASGDASNRILVREVAAGVAAQVAVLAGLGAGVGLGVVGWLTGLAGALGAGAVLVWAGRRTGAHRLGAASRVTLVRAVLVAAVAALAADGAGRGSPAGVVLIVAAIAALVLDAVDGRVARRTGTSTALGGRFDMEVDAALILVLSALVAASFGAWVLAIGAMRYLFAAAGRVAPWLRAPLPASRARQTVAVVQGVVLLVATASVLDTLAVAPRSVAVGAVAAALALLVWSFGRDVGHLWRARRSMSQSTRVSPVR